MKCIVKFINYCIDTNSEEINYKEYLNAIRRNDKEAYHFLEEHLMNKTKLTVYKYYAILKKFGIELNYLIEKQKIFIFEFLMNFEYVSDNFIAYFKGYLNNRFFSYLEEETTEKKKMNYYAESIDKELFSDSSQTLHDTLSCNEDIRAWYNGKDIADKYIYDNNNNLLDYMEKKVIHLRIAGFSFKEIAEQHNISYKICLTFYQNGINKIKNEIFA